MKDLSKIDGPEMAELLGVPGGFKYRDGEGVRPVDKDEVRAFHRGDLAPELRGDVARLIATNREWAIESAAVLRKEANVKVRGSSYRRGPSTAR